MGRPKKPQPTTERVGVNVRIPASVHRSAKIACAALGLTWDEFASEAFEVYARTRMRRLPVDEAGK